jgi:hypothetical protein
MKLTEPSLRKSIAVLWAIVFSNGNGSKQERTHLQLDTDFFTEGWHFICRSNESNTGTVCVGFVPANERELLWTLMQVL